MKKFENLGRRLSKEEQKNIMGGLLPKPTCRHHCNNGGVIMVSECESMDTAKDGAADCNEVWGAGSGGWCCDSCASAGWGAC